MPIPGLDTGGITTELKLRLKFYCSWTWWVLLLLLFVCLFHECGFFISIFIPIFFFLLSLPSPSSHPYSHPFHSSSFSCAKTHCSPSQLLFLPLRIHSQPLPSTSPSILPQPVTRLPLPPTYSSPADQPIIPTWHNLNSLYSLTQATYTTEIHPNTHNCHKTKQPLHCFPHSPTTFPTSTFTAALTNSPNFYS
jgi:hypothetical protein